MTDKPLSEFGQITPSPEAKGQEKDLFDAAVGALKRPEAKEFSISGTALRKIIILTSADKKTSLVVGAKISVVGKEDVDKVGHELVPEPAHIYVAWVNEGTKSGGRYIFHEHGKPVRESNANFLPFQLEQWKAGVVLWDNPFFNPEEPPELEVDTAIEVIKNGKPDIQFINNCVHRYVDWHVLTE